MKELIKFELEKIFKNKILIVTTVLVMVFVLSSVVGMFAGYEPEEEIKETANLYVEKNYSMKELKSLRREALQKVNNGEELNKEENFIYAYSSSIGAASTEENEQSIKDINESLDKLEENDKEDTFQYKDMSNEKEMIQNLPEGECIYAGDWPYVLDFNVEATMKLILLTLGLGGIFAKEYSSRVSYLNLSTKKGKTKLNTAKIITAFIYSTMVFVFVTLLFRISACYLGLPNGDKPISNLINSVYNMSINEYYLKTLAFSYLGTLLVSAFIILVSLISKNIIISFGLPIILYLVPDLINISDAINHFINYLNFARIFSGKEIFLKYVSFNIFGKVVLYPYVIGIASVIVIAVLMFIYYKCAGKQTIA